MSRLGAAGGGSPSVEVLLSSLRLCRGSVKCGHCARISIIATYLSKKVGAFAADMAAAKYISPFSLRPRCLDTCFQVCCCMWWPGGDFLGLGEET